MTPADIPRNQRRPSSGSFYIQAALFVAALLLSFYVSVVPALVLGEADYLLREDRAAMRKLAAEVFDPQPSSSPWRKSVR